MSLSAIVDSLAALEGGSTLDPSDGHERWALYRRASSLKDRTGLLFDAVRFEPDPEIALSLVLLMFDKLLAAEREAWAEQITTAKQRDFAWKRIRELDILHSAEKGELSLDRAADTHGEWSDWLQLRVADSAADGRILEILSNLGRTKRIRRIADNRIRSLKRE